MTLPNPVCACCSCTVYSSDTFSSTLDAKWTDESGSWSVSSGALVGTGAGLIYDSTEDPDGVGHDIAISVRYAFTLGGGATNTIRIIVSYLDVDNYLYAEIERNSAGATRVTLGERLAGVDTELSDPIPLDESVSLDTFRTLKLCYSETEGTLRASDTGLFGALVGVQADATGIGDKIALEIITGDAKFDDVSFSRGYSSDAPLCPTCNNTNCNIGSMSLTGSVNTFFWETITGSWGSGYVPTGDSILKYLRPNPTGKSTAYVDVAATVAVTETARVYVNYADSSNHLYADAGWDSTTVFRLSLYRVTSGTPTLLDERFMTIASPATFDKTITLKVCYDGTSLSAEAVNSSTGETLRGSSAATAITGGQWAAIGSNGGTDFVDFDFQKYYSAAEEEDDDDCLVCPTACGCLASHVPRGNYTVDFGAGGWTDGAGCTYCDQVAGEFVLGEWSDGTDCRATYLDEGVCTFTACDPGVDEDNDLFMQLSLLSAGGGQLKWSLDIELKDRTTADPGCNHASAEALYESDPFDTDECDVVPVTLTKVSDTINQGMCGGALPSTNPRCSAPIPGTGYTPTTGTARRWLSRFRQSVSTPARTATGLTLRYSATIGT